MIDYFDKHAAEIFEAIDSGSVSVEDVSIALQVLYASGVLDHALYTDEQKGEMFANIAKIYPHLVEKVN